MRGMNKEQRLEEDSKGWMKGKGGEAEKNCDSSTAMSQDAKETKKKRRRNTKIKSRNEGERQQQQDEKKKETAMRTR